MSHTTCAAALLVALACAPAAGAQLGEVHVGVLLSYGFRDAYGLGGGLVTGVAAGRLTYLGLRGAYYTSDTELPGTANAVVEVRNRALLLAADLGMQFPVGSIEIVPGVSIGAVRFAQRARSGGTASPQGDVHSDATRLLVAPGLSAQVRVLRFVVTPEMQWYVASDPELARETEHRGPVFSLRIVMPFEVGRVRH